PGVSYERNRRFEALFLQGGVWCEPGSGGAGRLLAREQRRPCNHTSSPVWQGFSSGSWLMRQRRLAAIWGHCKFASTLADGNVTFFDVPTGWRSNTQRRREASNIFRFENCKRTALDYIDPN